MGAQLKKFLGADKVHIQNAQRLRFFKETWSLCTKPSSQNGCLAPIPTFHHCTRTDAVPRSSCMYLVTLWNPACLEMSMGFEFSNHVIITGLDVIRECCHLWGANPSIYLPFKFTDRRLWRLHNFTGRKQSCVWCHLSLSGPAEPMGQVRHLPYQFLRTLL